jgi:hypothetical protein
VLVNYRTTTDRLIRMTLTIAPPWSNVTQVRNPAPFLADMHYSVCADLSLVKSLKHIVR